MSHAELLVGDPAPAITIETFLKGEPISAVAPGVVHVVEFWATWCGPCKASIPHLTEIQARYPHVIVIGITVGWTDLEEVRAFLTEWNAAIGYRIAVDRRAPGEARRTLTRNAWCDAAFQQGVPSAFIVDGSGKIAWIGHPMDIDDPLAAVVEGRWDLEAASKAHRDWLKRDLIREISALERQVGACLDADDRRGAIRAYEAAFAAEPALEGTHGFGKFKQLEDGSEESLAYARHLLAGPFAGSINGLYRIGVTLTQQAGSCEGAALDQIRSLAVQAFDAIWPLIGSEPEPSLVTALASTHAEALLVAGRTADAVSRASQALDVAAGSATLEDQVTDLQALLDRCREATASPAKSRQMMVCDGDTCSMVET